MLKIRKTSNSTLFEFCKAKRTTHTEINQADKSYSHSQWNVAKDGKVKGKQP